MKLHANAALSLNQRRRMVGRVVGQGWSLTKAAEAAEVSERTCAKWVARYRADGEAGCWIAPRPPSAFRIARLLSAWRSSSCCAGCG